VNTNISIRAFGGALLVAALAAGGWLAGSPVSLADETPAVAPKDAPAKVVVDLGNAKCPIMGGKVDGRTWSEWNGLRVGHCCGMCSGKFMAAPEKAFEKAGIDWKAAAAAIAKVNDAKTPADREAALKALRAKWTIVREPSGAGAGGIPAR
jgi:hypothetical protein